jgi:hypothetical protein
MVIVVASTGIAEAPPSIAMQAAIRSLERASLKAHRAARLRNLLLRYRAMLDADIPAVKHALDLLLGIVAVNMGVSELPTPSMT